MPLPPTWKGDETGKPQWLAQSRNRTQALKYGYERTKIIHTLGDEPGSAPGFIECYDLQNDANETHNLSSSPELTSARGEAVTAFKQHDWKQDRHQKKTKQTN
jgi:hypothetical protein